MKRTIAAAAIAAGTVLALAACGNDDDSGNSSETRPEATMHLETDHETTHETHRNGATQTTVTSTDQLGTFDQAKLTAFVAAFRTGYSDLSEDRDDASIENIAITSCNDLANGVDQQTVTDNLRSLAANHGTVPTQEQADMIYQMVTPACP